MILPNTTRSLPQVLPAGVPATQPVSSLSEVKVPAGPDAAQSRIENSINAASVTLEKVEPLIQPQRNLSQFGYRFFETTTPGSSPTVDTPVGPDYVVGPGDTIILSIWGSIDSTLALEVNRSGEVMLPRVGSLKVWGASFAQLPELIRDHLSKAFRNVHVNVTMGKLRLIKVYLVGEVKNPGGYDIGSLSTVINALSAAGGPTKSGTLRKIQVKRRGQTVETVDLYDFLIKGDKSRDIRLQSGDTIYVPPVGRVAGIDGNVIRPAIYELNGEKTLKDLVALAEGILPTGYLQRVQISRVSAHQKKEAADLTLDPKAGPQEVERLLGSVALQDMDTVTVLPIDNLLRDHVRLTGYLLRPGDYAFTNGIRVKDILTSDMLLPEYYPAVAELTRYTGQDLRPVKIYFDLGNALAGDPQSNLQLQEFDIVRVFSRWEMEDMPKVRISGEVKRPGDYRVFDKTTLRDLVFAAGNLKNTAYLKNAEITRSVVRKDGVRTHIINVDLDEALKGNASDNIQLQNFDEVTIRRLPEWKEETDRYCTLTGEVRFPGVYPILRGERLSSVIERAGGFTEKAYLKGVKFTRVLTREIQQKRMDEVITRTEAELARKQQELTAVAASKEELESTKAALEGMKASLEKLKLARAEGRISIVLQPLAQLKHSPYDIELQGGDTLNIPQSSNSINVFGEVYNPTTVIQTPGGDVTTYLRKAGGPTTNADQDEMYVVRADGTVVSKHEMSGFFFDHFKSLKLDAGDTIVVPQQLEKIAWMRELKDIAFIIGQTALAAGVVIAAGI
jgi:polysaccharide biosynthesis/export protein